MILICDDKIFDDYQRAKKEMESFAHEKPNPHSMYSMSTRHLLAISRFGQAKKMLLENLRPSGLNDRNALWKRLDETRAYQMVGK